MQKFTTKIYGCIYRFLIYGSVKFYGVGPQPDNQYLRSILASNNRLKPSHSIQVSEASSTTSLEAVPVADPTTSWPVLTGLFPAVARPPPVAGPTESSASSVDSGNLSQEPDSNETSFLPSRQTILSPLRSSLKFKKFVLENLQLLVLLHFCNEQYEQNRSQNNISK